MHGAMTREAIGLTLMTFGAHLQQAFPSGFECPPWADLELRFGKRGAEARFYTHYDGRVLTSATHLNLGHTAVDEPIVIRNRMEGALEKLRSELESVGAPVPGKLEAM